MDPVFVEEPKLSRLVSLDIAQVGWGGRIRTFAMTGPKPVALPLGYSPTIKAASKKLA